MPLYEYFCVDCRKVFEAFRPMHQADEPIRCHQCEGLQTRRALSLFNAHGTSRGSAAAASGGGCGCGGACACGHSHN
ncbi:MAG: zinc ribbon domain-containing protein [Chloroflexi bacterium]|nr:zinc ribbon domain-containing protein [Chloroflexota bacterium]